MCRIISFDHWFHKHGVRKHKDSFDIYVSSPYRVPFLMWRNMEEERGCLNFSPNLGFSSEIVKYLLYIYIYILNGIRDNGPVIRRKKAGLRYRYISAASTDSWAEGGDVNDPRYSAIDQCIAQSSDRRAFGRSVCDRSIAESGLDNAPMHRKTNIMLVR